MTLLGKAEPRTGINTVEMNGRNKRPSKYKRIYPTTLKDLHEHHPEQHTRAELSESLLNSLSTGWRVKLVFIHRENLEVCPLGRCSAAPLHAGLGQYCDL